MDLLTVKGALPEVVKRNIEAKYNLDDPLPIQYGRYMFDVLRGDLGPSFRYKDHDVNFYIFNSLPNSMILGIIAISISVIFGISSGMVAAVKQNTWADYLGMALAIVGDLCSTLCNWSCASICICDEAWVGFLPRDGSQAEIAG